MNFTYPVSLLMASALPAPVAEPNPAPVLASARFEQVALTVGDLDQAREFYGSILGLRLMFEANNMLFFDVSGTRLMIALDAEREGPRRPASILYFHVDDFRAALVRLRGSGAKLVGAVETVRENGDGRLQLQQFEDHAGNMLAIMGFAPL